MLIGSLILGDWGTVIDDSVTPPKVDYHILRKGELSELHGWEQILKEHLGVKAENVGLSQ